VRALTNIRRYAKFTAWVMRDLQARPAGRVIGFNKMPGLDFYYAADPCYTHPQGRGAARRAHGRFAHAQTSFDRWRGIYNQVRPH